MIQYSPTVAPAVIRSFLTPEKVWRWCVEDGVTQEGLEQIPFGDRYVYLVAHEGRVPIGLFTFEGRTSAKWQVRLAISPNQWARATDAFKGALEWAFLNIEGLERIAGEIPMDNTHAMRLFKRAGFHVIGEEFGAYRHGGKLQGLRIVGRTKEATCSASIQ